LTADIGIALTQGNSLQMTLDQCAELIVRHLNVALAQIWTLRDGENLPELQASAGIRPDIEGANVRVPAVAPKIARIAEQCQPYVTNAVMGDPEVADQEWARQEGMVAFAGYPLIVEQRLVGVAAVFAREPLSESRVKSLASRSDQLASGIQGKLAERALRLSEERFRIAAENGSDIVTIWDIQTDQVQTSGAVDRMLGAGGEMPRNWAGFRRLLYADDRERISAAIQHHLVSHEPYRQEYRVVDRDGTLRHWYSRGAAVWNPAGEATQFIVVTTDVTEEKEAEAALSHLAAIIESSEASILSMHLDGTVLTWNPAAERIYGYSLDEVKGRSVSVIYPADRHQELAGLLQKLQHGEGIQHIETVGKRKNGETIPVYATYSPLRDASGKITGACAIATDITDRKLLERRLFQAQKLESIGQLAAGIAHEINTPIQYVGDNTRFLRDSFGKLQQVCESYHELLAALQRGADPAPFVSRVQGIVESTRVKHLCAEIPNAIEDSLEGVSRVGNIVRAIKEFSHPGSAEKTPSDLNQAIASTVLVCRNEWRYVAELALDLDPELPPVRCVAGEFNQVILNLIVNAAHAIGDAVAGKPEAKGTIGIRTRRVGTWAEIRVRDTGAGIPEAVRPNIFNPFFTTKPVGKGTGQGLAVAHAVIVQKHGGTIDFETEMGAGTTFIIRLPIGTPGNDKSTV
jgi:PAS domain S-box-containing protein